MHPRALQTVPGESLRGENCAWISELRCTQRNYLGILFPQIFFEAPSNLTCREAGRGASFEGRSLPIHDHWLSGMGCSFLVSGGQVDASALWRQTGCIVQLPLVLSSALWVLSEQQ